MKQLSVGIRGSQIFSRNENSTERALKNTRAHPRGKWSQGCSIWRVILCHPDANYSLDSTGKPLLLAVHTWRGRFALWKAQNRGNHSRFGTCGLEGDSRAGRGTSAGQGLPHALGVFRSRARQFLILLSRQEGKAWEEP